MANLAQMRYDWSAVIPALEAQGWPAADVEALAAQAKDDMASGNAALIDAWAAWLALHRAELCARLATQRCATCAHQRTPGDAVRSRPWMSTPYCAGDRPDLPHAYTAGHVLRQLPADNGVNCPVWSASTC